MAGRALSAVGFLLPVEVGMEGLNKSAMLTVRLGPVELALLTALTRQEHRRRGELLRELLRQEAARRGIAVPPLEGSTEVTHAR